MPLCHSDRRSLRPPPYPGRHLGHLRQRCSFFVVGTLLGVVRPSLWRIWNGSLCGGHRRHWQGRSYWRGRRYWRGAVTGGAAVTGGPLQSLAGMVGASWDLQAEGYQRGEGTDLVAPAELSPNGNRCPLGSIPCRPQGPPICTQSPARIVPPCTGDTRADVIPNRFPLRMVVN